MLEESSVPHSNIQMMDATLANMMTEFPQSSSESSLRDLTPPVVDGSDILQSMLGDSEVVCDASDVSLSFDQTSQFSADVDGNACTSEYLDMLLSPAHNVNKYLSFGADATGTETNASSNSDHAHNHMMSSPVASSSGMCRSSPSSPTSADSCDDIMDLPLVRKSRSSKSHQSSSAGTSFPLIGKSSGKGKGAKKGKGRGPGRIPKRSASGEYEVTEAEAALLLMKPKKCRKKAKFDSPVASRFCHICSRTPKNVRLAVCKKICDGVCRKVICEKCFVDYQYGNFEEAITFKEWLCPHCSGICPKRAQCGTYSRINDKLRVTRLKQPKQPRKTPAKKQASVGSASVGSSSTLSSTQVFPASSASSQARNDFETPVSYMRPDTMAATIDPFDMHDLPMPCELSALVASDPALVPVLVPTAAPAMESAKTFAHVPLVTTEDRLQGFECTSPLTSYEVCVEQAPGNDELSVDLFPSLLDPLVNAFTDPTQW